jgi:ABC-2 type transport system ATP-binding protein
MNAKPGIPNPAAIEFDHVTKRYGNRAAVDDLTFRCDPGTVTGFLGPNGAGKSTALRILTGLAQADTGAARIGGRAFRDLEHPARTIGVMLDATALHRGRTGIETLRLAGRTIGMPRSRADEVLAAVGLEDAARKRVGGYSYGMRQRLGIGVALMGDPRVLVLDEPANGLDPEGIRWMRHLLRSFAADGGTVLLSSHQLREVQATVDQLAVISQGRLVHDGTLDDLTGAEGTRVKVEDAARFVSTLEKHGLAFEARSDGRFALREEIVLVSLAAADGGGLEEAFFALTGQRTPAGTASADQRGRTDPAPTPDAPHEFTTAGER